MPVNPKRPPRQPRTLDEQLMVRVFGADVLPAEPVTLPTAKQIVQREQRTRHALAVGKKTLLAMGQEELDMTLEQIRRNPSPPSPALH